MTKADSRTLSFKEDEKLDRKSLRLVQDAQASFHELAKDCVCFANGAGGTLIIGVEDDATEPAADQRVDLALLEKIKKRIGELTVNVSVAAERHVHANGGEYIRLNIRRASSVASTSDGRFYLRIADECHPLVGDDVMRLSEERPGTSWEAMTSLKVEVADLPVENKQKLCSRLRQSDRLKASVKEKSDPELLDHYALCIDKVVTNLGILLLGSQKQRRMLSSAPLVQAIKYDEQRKKVAKWLWDDLELSPIELLDAIWKEIPDFRESYELPDGMFRTKVPAFEEAVIREALVNALVHRPYTQRGDIYLNLHPDHLELVNPGRLPLGVTPKNILHASRRRNEGLARIFHDLGLMEKEGSGIDLLYERLLAGGKGIPLFSEGTDSVHVTIPRRVIHPAVVGLLTELDARFHLTQRERIVVGILAQTEGLTAAQLADPLEVTELAALRPWLERLLSLGVLEQSGRTKGTRYFVRPGLLKEAGLDELTSLSRVEAPRLRALILEDLERHSPSPLLEIQRRIGPEIPQPRIRRILTQLRGEGLVATTGARRGLKYHLPKP